MPVLPILLALLLQDAKDPKDEKFRYNAWEAWNSFGEGSSVTLEMESTPKVKVKWTWRLAKKEADKLTVEQETGVSKGQPLLIERRPDGWAEGVDVCKKCMTHLSSEREQGKEKLKIGDKELECDWIEFRRIDCSGRTTYSHRIWYHKSVPGWQVRWETKHDGRTMLLTLAASDPK